MICFGGPHEGVHAPPRSLAAVQCADRNGDLFCFSRFPSKLNCINGDYPRRGPDLTAPALTMLFSAVWPIK
jgi:hypothetical protein